GQFGSINRSFYFARNNVSCYICLPDIFLREEMHSRKTTEVMDIRRLQRLWTFDVFWIRK
ncbi:38904_t:CDS:1, partial [Gigaspora margarita]